MVEQELQLKVEHKTKRKTKLKATILRASDLSSFWRDTILEYFPDARVGSLTTIERKIMSSKQTWFKKAARGTFNFSEFIEWSIENWKDIMEMKFGWMVDAPDLPNARFFLSQFSKFYHLFEFKDRNWKQIMNPQTSPENKKQEKEIEKLKKELNTERGKVAVLQDLNKLVSRRRKVKDNTKPEDHSGEMNLHKWNDEGD